MRRYGYILFAAVLVAGHTGFALTAKAGSDMACRAVTLIDRTTGTAIIGPEDIAVDYDANLAYISAYDRRTVEEEVGAGEATITPGGIYLLDLSDLSPLASSATVEDLTQEFKEEADFRPHGIDLQGDRLLAVNRAYVSDGESVRLEPAVERFRVEDGGTLAHLATLRPENDDELMCSPNDVLGVGADSFLVTNDHGACGGFGRFWEEAWGKADAHVVQFKAGKFSKVLENLAYPNGLAMHDTVGGKRLLVSETRREGLQIFELDSEGPREAETIHLPGSPDNLSWERAVADDGRLLVAVIPDAREFAFYRRGWFGTDKSPSRIVAVSAPFSAVSDVEVIFEDDGSLISAATVMADARDVRLIGAVLEDHIVVCNKTVENTNGHAIE